MVTLPHWFCLTLAPLNNISCTDQQDCCPHSRRWSVSVADPAPLPLDSQTRCRLDLHSAHRTHSRTCCDPPFLGRLPPFRDQSPFWGWSSVGQSIGLLRHWHRFNSPVWPGIFLPGSTFSADSLTCVRTTLCAIACINIYAHVKDPVVHVRVQWIMLTLKHPACTVGWVVQLCHSWLSPGKATQISHGRNPFGTIQFFFHPFFPAQDHTGP